MWILIHHIMMLLSVIMYTILYIPYLICSVRASGQFWIRLISYQNSDGMGSNGHPCDGKFFVRVGSCDHRFLVCVDDSFNLKNSERCRYGSKDTGEIPDSDSINFLDRAGQLQNPLVYKFNRWPGSVAVKVKVTDVDDNSDDDVDFFSKVFTGKPAVNVSESKYIPFNLASRTSMKTEVKVFCNVYFHGDYCDVFCVPRDDDSNGHYKCDPITGQKLCLQGWTGDNCNTDVDAGICQQNPCQNGGTCFQQDKKISCLCPSDYNGETCNKAIERCRPSPCLNGGTCINMEGTFRCNCPSGFIGSTCSERTEKCDFHGEVSCQNNGTCFKKNGVPVCACASGWTGRYCEVDLDECKNYPCENNALCINTRGNFYCKCSNGFTGRTCDKITSCSQCFGASKCLFSKKENSLVCVCSKGYTGILCNEKEATNCISSKCRNNGTCHVRGDQYTCECLPEWTGETCEHEILGLKEECSGGNCDDHCNNPNGTSSFLLKNHMDDSFEDRLLEVLKEHIVHEAAAITVTLSHTTVTKSGFRLSSPTNVTFDVFINNTKVCPEHVDDLVKSFDVHDLDFLGILRGGTVPDPDPHSPDHLNTDHWRIGVIAFTIVIVVIGTVMILVYLCKRRPRSANSNPDFEPSTTATFENQTYSEFQPLQKD